MTTFHQKHQVRDGSFGVLHALFGVGSHHVQILNDKGQVIGRGSGPTEAAARERAWKDLRRQDVTPRD
jgi:hypothetical protein